jgi:anti-anti-sigma regulatory factor
LHQLTSQDSLTFYYTLDNKQVVIANSVVRMASKKWVEQKENQESGIVLPARLSINSAAELRKNLMNLLDGNGSIEIDASEVERITTPCIQIIIAMEKSTASAGRKFKVVNPSAAFSDAFATLGLSSYLQSWSN